MIFESEVTNLLCQPLILQKSNSNVKFGIQNIRKRKFDTISFCSFKSFLKGTVVLVFQPAEEGGGGAKKIVDAGALENVSAIFGLHVLPNIPIGEVGSRSGPIMAGSGFFEAVISGKGGHAALPQHSIDPILAASNVIVSLQHLVSREADPLDSQASLFY